MPAAIIRSASYFGDEHVHTAWSVDAGGGGTTLGPEEAVRFARGEEVVSTSGQPVKLGKPLDWVAVTDHSDAMGVITEIKAGNAEMMQDATLKRWHDMFAKGGKEANAAVFELIARASEQEAAAARHGSASSAKAVWDKNIAIQEKYNEPGRFTAFIAYEWTSNAGGGDNLHRNVIYRDGKAKAEQVLPMTTFQSENPEDLWKWMAAWETEDRRQAARHSAQRQPVQRPDVRAGHLRRRSDDQAVGRGRGSAGSRCSRRCR